MTCAVSHRIMENGQERVEVEEDGQLKSVSINGEEQPFHSAPGRKPPPHAPKLPPQTAAVSTPSEQGGNGYHRPDLQDLWVVIMGVGTRTGN